MKTLFIHSGLPKTGSSALQVFLARNQAALRQQSIDYFPLGEFTSGSAGKISSGNGFHIARSLLPRTDPSRTENPAAHLAALTRAIATSPYETGLLSSEYFVDCDQAALGSWVNALQSTGLTVQTVYFIRAQTQLLSSMYVQYVKRSHCRETPQAYVARTYKTVPYLNHATYHATQCDIFAPANVTCLLYEDAIQTENGLFHAFLSAIGASPKNLDFSASKINTGLTPAELAIMRELNKYRPHTRISDILVENARQAGTGSFGETYAFLPAALTAEIETHFAAENATLAQRLFHRPDLFPPAPLTDNPITIGDFSQTDLVNVLGGLLVRYDERLAQLESERANTPTRRAKRLLRRLLKTRKNFFFEKKAPRPGKQKTFNLPRPLSGRTLASQPLGERKFFGYFFSRK